MAFCCNYNTRIGIGKVPDAKTLVRIAQALGGEVIAEYFLDLRFGRQHQVGEEPRMSLYHRSTFNQPDLAFLAPNGDCERSTACAVRIGRSNRDIGRACNQGGSADLSGSRVQTQSGRERR